MEDKRNILQSIEVKALDYAPDEMGCGSTKPPKFISKSHYFYPYASQDISFTQDTTSPKAFMSKYNHSALSIDDEAAALSKDDVRIDQPSRSQAVSGKGSRTIKSQHVRARPNKRYNNKDKLN